MNAGNGEIVVGRNGQGYGLDQLDGPTDVIIDQETNALIIADPSNRRVMQWSYQNKTNGEIIIRDIDCSHLALGKNGCLYVSNQVKNEVRRWKRGENGQGTIVAGGNGNGNQLNCPTFIFVDEDDSLYATDQNNHRVMKWKKNAKEGIVVAGGNSKGKSLRQLSSPEGIIVDQLGQIYVADFDNNRVMRWCDGEEEGTIVVGGNERGQEPNQLNGPRGLSFDGEGNLYVVDYRNNRIQKFEIERKESNYYSFENIESTAF